MDTLTMVFGLAASADGRIAASAGVEPGSLRLWDVASGRMIRQIGTRWPVMSLSFSKDGQQLATVGHDGKIRIYNVATGQIIKTVAFSGRARSISFSMDGRYLAAACLGSPNAAAVNERINGARIWDTVTGALVAVLPNDEAHSVAFTADGSRLLVAGQHLKLFDIKSAREISDIATTTRAIAITRDGSTAVTGDESGVIRTWDLKTSQLIRQYSETTQFVNGLTFPPDEKSIIAVGSKINVYDVSASLIRSFPDPWGINVPSSFAALPNGQIITNSSDIREMVVWDPRSGKPVQRMVGSKGPVRILKFAPNTNVLFARRDDGTFTAWDLVSGVAKTMSPERFRAYAETFRGGTVSKDVFLDLLGQSQKSPISQAVTKAASNIDTENGIWMRLQLSPTGTTAAFSKSDGSLNFIDTQSGALSSMAAHAPVRYPLPLVAYSPEGSFIYSADNDGIIKKWDALDHSLKWSVTASHGRIKELAVSPDGRSLLSNGDDHTFKIIDTASGRLLHELNGQLGSAENLLFVPNSNLVAGVFPDEIGNKEDVRLWDARSGQLVKSLGSVNGVVQLTTSKDGRYLVSGGYDTSLHLWKVDSGELVATEYSAGVDEWVVVTPEGFFDASSPNATRYLSIVRGLEVSSVEQVYNALYRPDLVREKLAGDPNGKVKAAAAQLNLDKVMASGMAPKVTITSPASGSSSEIDEVTVEATIADQGGGIGKVEWRVNGITLGLETRGLDRIQDSNGSDGAGRIQTVKRKLSLEPSDNRIEVVAYNAKGLIASEPAQISVKWDGAKTANPPKLYVLAVGVNDYYDSRLHLAYAVPDATALADGFKKAGAGLYADVEVKTVLDSDVTLSNLDKAFAELSKKVQPRDVFVFFLAGHGKTKNGRYYFLPRDFRYEDETSIEKAGMGQDKFQAWFASIPARKSLLLYDTCESGSLTGATRGSDVDERLGALNRMARATGRTFLTATTDDAPALEGYRGHGVFTYALLDALDHGDVNKNGLIEVSELADYIDQKVPDYSYEAFKLRQIPQRSIVGNNFALTNKAEVLAAAQAVTAAPLNNIATSATPSGAAANKPTHVIITPANVFEQLAGQGGKVEQLPAGTLLSLVKTQGGWSLVARDGKQLGYVEANQLARIQ